MVHRSYSDNSLAVVGIFFDSEKGGNQRSDFIEALQVERLVLPNVTQLVASQIPLMPLIRQIKTDKLYMY